MAAAASTQEQSAASASTEEGGDDDDDAVAKLGKKISDLAADVVAMIHTSESPDGGHILIVMPGEQVSIFTVLLY